MTPARANVVGHVLWYPALIASIGLHYFALVTLVDGLERQPRPQLRPVFSIETVALQQDTVLMAPTTAESAAVKPEKVEAVEAAEIAAAEPAELEKVGANQADRVEAQGKAETVRAEDTEVQKAETNADIADMVEQSERLETAAIEAPDAVAPSAAATVEPANIAPMAEVASHPTTERAQTISSEPSRVTAAVQPAVNNSRLGVVSAPPATSNTTIVPSRAAARTTASQPATIAAASTVTATHAAPATVATTQLQPAARAVAATGTVARVGALTATKVERVASVAPLKPTPPSTPAPQPEPPEIELAMQTPPVEEAPVVQVPAPPTQAEVMAEKLQDVQKFVASYNGDSCFIAMPTATVDTGISVDVYAKDISEHDGFRAAFDRAFAGAAPTTFKHISEQQCRVLSYLRAAQTYPTFGLSLNIDTQGIQSGGFLAGSIDRIDGRKIYLMVVDDDGLVQSITSLLQLTDGIAEFSVQLNATEGEIVTEQLLFAMAAPLEITTVKSANNTLADSYFAALTAELATLGIQADFAITAFTVR